MQLINKITLEYPTTLEEVRRNFPNVSFSNNPTDEDLSPFGYANVHSTPCPQNTRELRVVESSPILTETGWYQTWDIRNSTPEEIADWDAVHSPVPEWGQFSIEIILNPTLSGVYEMLPRSIANGLSIGLSDASKGDTRLFTGLWQRVLQMEIITDDIINEIVEMAKKYYLPKDFIATLQPQFFNDLN